MPTKRALNIKVRRFKDSIIRTRFKLYKVKVWVKADDAQYAQELDFYIQSGSEEGRLLVPAWVWYLRMCGEQKIVEEAKRDVLRHDGDASRLLKDEILCRGCDMFVNVRNNAGRTTLVNWVSHKLICENLRKRNEESFATHHPNGASRNPDPSDEDDEHSEFAPEDNKSVKGEEESADEANESTNEDDESANNDNNLLSTAMRCSLDNSKRERRSEELVKGKVLCRVALGIQEVVTVRKFVNGRPPSHLHIEVDGDTITPLRFLFYTEEGERRDPLEVIEHDVDGVITGNTIRCTACSKDFQIRRADRRTVALETWAEHKFVCTKLQQLYHRELKTTSHTNVRSIGARDEQHRSPAVQVRNGTSSRLKVTGAGPVRRKSLSRRLESSSDSESESSNVKCKKRHVHASGEIDEIEVGFPSNFAKSHLDFVANIINNFKNTANDEAE